MLRIGPAGWSYDDWKGIVYPPGMPRTRHPLSLLAPWFRTVELNISFYRPLNTAHVEGWVRRVEPWPDFRFTAKLYRAFTHERAAWPDADTQAQTHAGLLALAEAGRLGAVLVQFPWSFKRIPENRRWLARVLDAFSDYPLVVEVRHASWDREEVFAAMAERGIAFCNIDQPLFHDSLDATEHTTAPVGYVRLHGHNAHDWFREDAGRNERYDYLYSQQELTPWIEKIERMRKRVNDLYVVTNNHYQGQAVVNALEIAAATMGQRFRLPEHLVSHYPRLRGLLQEAP